MTFYSTFVNQIQGLIRRCSQTASSHLSQISELVTYMALEHVPLVTLSLTAVTVIRKYCIVQATTRLIVYSFAFQCLAAEGAVLVLHEGATAYEAVNMIDFERHASRHAISWYEYALNTGRNLSNGSLDFVTECIKSANWGIAVFYARPDADGYLRFIVNEGSYRWQRRGKVEARVGPSPTDISASDGERIRSQCVFLHGYKIMLRSDILEKLIKKNPWL